MSAVLKRGKHLHFRLMVNGRRYQMPVNRFAIPRMSPEERRLVTNKSEAERVWLPRFQAEILGGLDPTRPLVAEPVRPKSVRGFLDEYERGYVDIQALRSRSSVRSLLRMLRLHLGHHALETLEDPATIDSFIREYSVGRALATVNRALSVLRHAIGWGIGRRMLARTPFHRQGVRLTTRFEARRDRRLSSDEENRLLAAAERMSSAEHRCVGILMKDRITAALETGCRQGEMLKIQNRHVHWDQHQILIPNTNAKAGKARKIPFNPNGKLAEILKRRATLGPNAYVFGGDSGEYVSTFRTAWETLLLMANGLSPVRKKRGGRVDRAAVRFVDLHWHDLRHEAACRWLYQYRFSLRTIQLMLGHADLTQTQRYLNVNDDEILREVQQAWRQDPADAR